MGAIIAAAGASVSRAGAVRRQGQLDRAAVQAFVDGDFSGKALFLRPFGTDGCFTLEREAATPFDWDQYDRPDTDTLERMIADAFSRTCPLVGAGDKGGRDLGAATAGLLDDWQPRISEAIRAASWIVLVPSANAGTLWEIGEILRSRALARTIFIMPPSEPPMSFLGTVPYGELWSRAARACAREHGLLIPPYDPAGRIFSLDPATRRVGREAGFDLRSPRALAAAINRVL